MSMLEAYLAGEVPHAVMVDWCEENGVVFPRRSPGAGVLQGRRRHDVPRPCSASRSREGRRFFSVSSGRRRHEMPDSTSRSSSDTPEWRSYSGSRVP